MTHLAFWIIFSCATKGLLKKKTIAFLVDLLSKLKPSWQLTTIHLSSPLSALTPLPPHSTKFNLIIISGDELPQITTEYAVRKWWRTVIYSNPFKVFGMFGNVFGSFGTTQWWTIFNSLIKKAAAIVRKKFKVHSTLDESNSSPPKKLMRSIKCNFNINALVRCLFHFVLIIDSFDWITK